MFTTEPHSRAHRVRLLPWPPRLAVHRMAQRRIEPPELLSTQPVVGRDEPEDLGKARPLVGLGGPALCRQRRDRSCHLGEAEAVDGNGGGGSSGEQRAKGSSCVSSSKRTIANEKTSAAQP